MREGILAGMLFLGLGCHATPPSAPRPSAPKPELEVPEYLLKHRHKSSRPRPRQRWPRAERPLTLDRRGPTVLRAKRRSLPPHPSGSRPNLNSLPSRLSTSPDQLSRAGGYVTDGAGNTVWVEQLSEEEIRAAEQRRAQLASLRARAKAEAEASRRAVQLAELAELAELEEIGVPWIDLHEFKQPQRLLIAPGVAGNGSYYGQLNRYGVPKTVFVSSYKKRDGTRVRSHYRAGWGANPAWTRRR